jgi:hypothetical protein
MAPSAADAASRRRRGTLAVASLLAVLGVAALLLLLSSSVAEAVSSASLLTFDCPWRNPLYAEVRGGVAKSVVGVHARLLRHSVRPHSLTGFPQRSLPRSWFPQPTDREAKPRMVGVKQLQPDGVNSQDLCPVSQPADCISCPRSKWHGVFRAFFFFH